jgi:PRTRC genetic system protein C
MALKQAKRVFKYGQITLEDPDPTLSIEKVKEFYANVYPELTQSDIDGPQDENGQIVVEFEKTVGTKGAGDRISIADIAKGKATIGKRNGVSGQTFQTMGKFHIALFGQHHGRNKKGMVLPPSEVLPLV